MTHGSCNFAPAKDVEQVHELGLKGSGSWYSRMPTRDRLIPCRVVCAFILFVSRLSSARVGMDNTFGWRISYLFFLGPLREPLDNSIPVFTRFDRHLELLVFRWTVINYWHECKPCAYANSFVHRAHPQAVLNSSPMFLAQLAVHIRSIDLSPVPTSFCHRALLQKSLQLGFPKILGYNRGCIMGIVGSYTYEIR